MTNNNFPKYARMQLRWKIANFNERSLDRNINIESNLFQIELRNHQRGRAITQWKLSAQKNRTTLSLYLAPSEKYPNPHYNEYSRLIVNYEMKLKTCYGDYTNKSKGSFTGIHFVHRLGKIFSSADLNKSTSWRLFDNKSIEIIIDLEMIEEKKNTIGKIPPSICELSNQYETLYNSDKYSDFILVTADQEEIPVHKNILSSRSPVFEAMMETKLKEGEDKKAVIDDIDSRALKEFLRFLYCGRVNEIEPIAVELMYAAEKYDIKDLKPLCTESLTKNISIKNAIETFILADLHREEDLKLYCLDFILWNYKELKDHESWENVSKELMKQILDRSTDEVKTEKIIKLNSSLNPPPAATTTATNNNPARPAAVPVRIVGVPNANVANNNNNNLANANAIINQLARAALN